MNKYIDVDPTLSDWAELNSIVWLTDYQDSVVRTFLIEPDSKNRVQIWVDPASDGQTTVHVFQNNMGRRWKKEEDYPCNVNDLPNALDKAFAKAKEWVVLP
jgi:hypothetical protein